MNATEKLPLPNSEEISAAIEVSKGKRDFELSNEFGKCSKTEGDGWHILQQVFDFHFEPSSSMEPFGPMVEMDGKRSMIPNDLSDEQLDELQTTLDSVTDPEYRARIGDILWLRRKDPIAARIAVGAYLEAGSRLEDPEDWVESMERYERAVRLARQIEPKGELPRTVLAHLEGRVIHYDGYDPLYFTCKALALLAEFRYGGFLKLAAIAGRVAEQSYADRDFSRARNYFEVQAKHLKLAKKADQAEAARVAVARSFVAEAEHLEVSGGFLAAHSFWGDAIRAFRDRPSLRKEIPELQKRYSMAGERLLGEMSTITSDEIDITKYVEESRSAVRNLLWDDAFYEFVMLVPLIASSDLRRETQKQIARYPLQATISATFYDPSGRKVAIRPSALTDDKDQYEKALCGFMEQNAQIQRHMVVHSHIAPAMRQIIEDHEIDLNSISKLIGDSALIPEDRRDWFSEAVAAGFNFDFSAALHILIPQLENCLRYALEQHEISPVNIDIEGIEEVWGIERILSEITILEILGEDFVFELRSLLVERMGPNLRNLFAHGALPPDGFRGENAFYLWWVIVRLVALPTSGMRAFMERKKATRAGADDQLER